MRPMDPTRYRKLKASGRLPSPKGVAVAIIRLLQQDDFKIDDLVRLLQSDPAIAGRLLKFANAGAMGNARPVVSIAKAVVVLGAYRVRDLVLGFSILHGYRRDGCDAFDYRGFWSRSLATAIAAQTLARHAQIAAEEAFTLGLLCDVGVLALSAVDCDSYRRMLQSAAAAADGDMLAAERVAFGTDHRELGAALMVEWGLPETLAAAAYHCEAPDAGGFADGSRNHVLALSLHFARVLAGICVAADSERSAMLPELYAKAARLGIAPDELAVLADDVAGRWRAWGSALEIDTRELPPFADLLSAVPVPPPQADIAGNARSQRLALLIGADAAEAASLQSMIENLGFGAQCVVSGIDGLMAALRDKPELIVADLDSPELSGPAFCRAFRESPLAREAYLVLVGNREQEPELSLGVEAGADDFLVRPVSEDSLRARLRTADKIVHLRDEIRRERRGLVRSAHEWAGSQRRMMQAALTDPLTQLPNRRYGMDFLTAECVAARGNNVSLACLMVDIDHFKAVNDRYGHDGGDAVLAGVARVLGDNCRSEDAAFRFGGEEFCVVCPRAGLEAAQAIAERIRAGIEAEIFRFGEDEIRVTVSVGIAVSTPARADAEVLLRDADGALYCAKETGRNRVADAPCPDAGRVEPPAGASSGQARRA